MDLEGQSDKALAYVTFRLSLGIGELMHGLVRLPILATFAADMAKGFEGTILPGWFVYAFGLALPFLEVLIGISLILGLLMKTENRPPLALLLLTAPLPLFATQANLPSGVITTPAGSFPTPMGGPIAPKGT